MRVLQEGPVNTGPIFSLGPTIERFQVVERERGNVWIELALDNDGGTVFCDFNVTEDGFHFINDTLIDGEDRVNVKPWSVFISPRRDYFIVQKQLDATTEVVNVYRRRHSTAAVIRPQRLRFDDACVAWYCHQHRLPFAYVTGQRRPLAAPSKRANGYFRDLFLTRWASDHIGVFNVVSANYDLNNEKVEGNQAIFFCIYFDFARDRFLQAQPVKPWR